MSLIKQIINVEEIEKFYRIEEDGMVWSYRKNRYLKPTFNGAGYLYVFIGVEGLGKHCAVHRLVAAKYIGGCPLGKETDHKDGNKLNNHYTNLEYLTHSENLLKSYREDGRKPAEWLYHKLPFSVETKMKMADAKKKRVLYVHDGIETTFPSIEDAAQSLNTYRKKIYLCITNNKPFKDTHRHLIWGFLSFVDA